MLYTPPEDTDARRVHEQRAADRAIAKTALAAGAVLPFLPIRKVSTPPRQPPPPSRPGTSAPLPKAADDAMAKIYNRIEALLSMDIAELERRISKLESASGIHRTTH